MCFNYFADIQVVNGFRFAYFEAKPESDSIMRKRFEQQLAIGTIPIHEVRIPTQKRSGPLPALCAALKAIFVSPEWNEKVFEVLENNILSQNNQTGRPGMNLWQIFVLSQVRLCQNISYDNLHHIANYDSLIRQIMGVEKGFGYEPYELSYQNIIDNVGLLDDETVKELNNIIVGFAHETFKKKEGEALRLKTDSFVVESNVHFPTDYNLLWDCARKCTDMILHLMGNNNLPGWRKVMDWHRQLKNLMRGLGRACASGGKGKEQRVKQAARAYLTKAKALLAKLKATMPALSGSNEIDMVVVIELERFMSLLEKHIDLLERRLLKGEKIPHDEKLFSIFEPYTEWLSKGKAGSKVELGKNLAITTDQFHLIVDYHIMENQADSAVVPKIAGRLLSKYEIWSWSFDKGFWHRDNKELLSENVELLVLPKKGKCNQQEYQQEHEPKFIRYRNKHSAIESNINELEHRGLNICPDKGYPNFKRYIGLAVCAYNLKRTGEYLLAIEREKQGSRYQKAA